MAIDFSKIKFFVEGVGDFTLVRDLLKLWYGKTFSDEQLRELIVICDGFGQLKGKLKYLKETGVDQKREGGKNILIFDADYSRREQYHGFNEKKNYLVEQKKELSIDFEVFLFPDNANDGTIETLLESCINPDHKEIMNCWEGFEKCVESKGNYTIPANKSKIYVYLECLYKGSNSEKDRIKDRNRDFTEKDKWVMDYKQNPLLGKLKTFLDQQLQ